MAERGFVQVPLLYMKGANEVPEKWAKEVRFYGVLPKVDVE
jgi:hypothetical protein